jgi:hypothetical protein
MQVVDLTEDDPTGIENDEDIDVCLGKRGDHRGASIGARQKRIQRGEVVLP